MSSAICFSYDQSKTLSPDYGSSENSESNDRTKSYENRTCDRVFVISYDVVYQCEIEFQFHLSRLAEKKAQCFNRCIKNQNVR